MDKNQWEREGDGTLGNYEELSSKKEFKATPIKCLYNSEDYKIYACTINGFTYPQIKVSKYGTVTIKGDIQELNQIGRASCRERVCHRV